MLVKNDLIEENLEEEKNECLKKLGITENEAIELFVLMNKCKTTSKDLDVHRVKEALKENNTSRVLERIDELVETFLGDSINYRAVRPSKIVNHQIDVPKVFKSYITNFIFQPFNSAVIKKIPYRDGYIIEKIENIYYFTNDYDLVRRRIVSSDAIEKFGLPEEISDEMLISMIDYLCNGLWGL